MVPHVIEACAERGWAIAGIAPERRTLERVFRDLQSQQVARVVGGEVSA